MNSIQSDHDQYDFKTSLEEDFYDYCIEQVYLDEEYLGRELSVGSIIMTNQASSGDETVETPHRMYVISKIDGVPGQRKYYGYLISSNTNKANVFNHRYPHNIYIDDLGAVLEKGYLFNKPSIIKLDTLFEFTDKDMEASGVYKGTTIPKFRKFIEDILNIDDEEKLSKIWWDSKKYLNLKDEEAVSKDSEKESDDKADEDN